jgi:predicted house-cleaning noncanonical NTP pyrophosphatase (MazG superfamily)
MFHHADTNHPMENEYPKLVRDFIPEIIKENTGTSPEFRKLEDDSEYLTYLLRKVSEEAQELSRAETDENIMEEMADVYEVIDAISALRNFSETEVRDVQDKKRKARGGFDDRLLMLDKVKPEN